MPATSLRGRSSAVGHDLRNGGAPAGRRRALMEMRFICCVVVVLRRLAGPNNAFGYSSNLSDSFRNPDATPGARMCPFPRHHRSTSPRRSISTRRQQRSLDPVSEPVRQLSSLDDITLTQTNVRFGCCLPQLGPHANGAQWIHRHFPELSSQRATRRSLSSGQSTKTADRHGQQRRWLPIDAGLFRPFRRCNRDAKVNALDFNALAAHTVIRHLLRRRFPHDGSINSRTHRVVLAVNTFSPPAPTAGIGVAVLIRNRG